MIFEEERLCYGELDRRANRLAHHLRARGVGPETVVGLCLARSLDLIVGLLGILKAGGAYLPLDPDYPPARLAFMLEDAGAEVLVTQDALLERLSAATAAHVPVIVRLDADAPAIAAAPQSPPAVALDPANPAYVIYTSGSTGTPKGVVVEHANLANKLAALTSDYRRVIRAAFRSAVFISCGFDAAIAADSAASAGGGAAIVLGEAVRQILRNSGRPSVRHEVSFRQLPCLRSLQSILRDAPEGRVAGALGDLGGEALTTDLARAISQPAYDRPSHSQTCTAQRKQPSMPSALRRRDTDRRAPAPDWASDLELPDLRAGRVSGSLFLRGWRGRFTFPALAWRVGISGVRG